MKKYMIEIEEILQRVVEIEAVSLDDAIYEVQKQYNVEDIILDATDLKEITIREFK